MVEVTLKTTEKRRIEDDLKDLLSQDERIYQLSQDIDIKFIGLDDRRSDQDLHLRCIYSDKFIVSIEHSFETRPLKRQRVWYGSEYSRSEIARDYHDKSNEFSLGFSFWADQIF